MSNSRLVYSTDIGRIKPIDKPKATTPPGDGIVRIAREKKGRAGKEVSVLRGFDMEAKELKALGKKLKQLCGTGGTIKDGIIEIQGDHRQKLSDYLTKQGYNVKLSGG